METFALVIESPGQIDMAGISIMASAMNLSVQSLSQAIYCAPNILARNIPAENLPELLTQCAKLGLDVTQAANDVVLAQNTETFQLALHIDTAEQIPYVVETLARITGVAAEQAFRMLATPPGQILGKVGAAAVNALKKRFGEGVEVLTALEGVGPFDLYLSRNMASMAVIRDLVGDQQGLIPLGLTAAQAKILHPRLPRGAARLIPRALLRFDIVLAAFPKLSPLAAPMLADLFAVSAEQVAQLQAHAPLALAERLPLDQAYDTFNRALAAGLPVDLTASSFELCDLIVETAPDPRALAEVLVAAGHKVPQRLPARVANQLADLDARWLAHSLERVGARIRFEEATS